MMPFMVGQLWLSTENISLYISLVCCGTSILPLQESDLGIAVIILEEKSNKIPIFTAFFLSISTPLHSLPLAFYLPVFFRLHVLNISSQQANLLTAHLVGSNCYRHSTYHHIQHISVLSLM